MFGRKKLKLDYISVTLRPDAYVEKLDRMVKQCDDLAAQRPALAIAMKAKAAAYINAKRLYLEMYRELITELHENTIEAIKRRDRGE